jgi:hypothetical protein
MLDALLGAGARYVVGGDGKNWAAHRRVTGAAALGQRFRQLLVRGFDPLMALALAKRWLKIGIVAQRMLGRKSGNKSGKMMASKDALEFHAYWRPE